MSHAAYSYFFKKRLCVCQDTCEGQRTTRSRTQAPCKASAVMPSATLQPSQ
ncbi:mCG1045338 [Mus musculus]|nr:mCG1045338 [Mus musculus]